MSQGESLPVTSPGRFVYISKDIYQYRLLVSDNT